MTKINEPNSRLSWLYKIGFSIILALPILTIPPYFFPADWGKSIIFRSIMAIILLLFVWQILQGKLKINLAALKKNKIVWALGVLLLVFLLATIFSVDPILSLWGNPIRSGGFVTFIFYFIFAVLAAALFKKDDWQKAFYLLILVGVLISLIALIQYCGLLSNIFKAEPGRPASTMGNPIALAVYLLVLFFLGISLVVKQNGVSKKALLMGSALLFLFIILISGSRAAYLGLTVGLLFFIFFYPQKIRAIKIVALTCLIVGAVFVAYINLATTFPLFLENSKIFKNLQPRFSIGLVAADPRFSAWSLIDTKILQDKPLLGYGPENFSVGFDKHYNPSLPHLSKNWGSWWDRAHNVLLDIGATTGIPAVIIYLLLIFAIIWELQKVKQTKEDLKDKLIIHGVQTSIIGYFVANLFWFDSFATYMAFFLLIGYSLHLTTENFVEDIKSNGPSKYATPATVALSIIVLIFLWQYNFVPFQINAQINKADDLAKRKYCGQAISLMDKILPSKSFLDSYSRMEYAEITMACIEYFPENKQTYLEKNFELIKEAVKIQPLYTRYWIALGNIATSLASYEQSVEAKNNLIKEAEQYFQKALQLAPKHQEIFIGQAEAEIVATNYKAAEELSQKCIVLDSSIGDCYFYLALSQIYQKNTTEAQENIKTASNKLYITDSKEGLLKLSDAYGAILDYNSLIPIYQRLTLLEPNNAQYHSSLAFFYKEIGQYKHAKEEALKVLDISPQSKPNVDEFLKTLYY